jgi:hypothetical protein
MDPSFDYFVYAKGTQETDFYGYGTKRFSYECLVIQNIAKSLEKTAMYDASAIKQQLALILGEEIFVFKDKKTGLLVPPEIKIVPLLAQAGKDMGKFDTLLTAKGFERVRVGAMNADRSAITELDANYRPLFLNTVPGSAVKFTPGADGTYDFTLKMTAARTGARKEVEPYSFVVTPKYVSHQKGYTYREKPVLVDFALQQKELTPIEHAAGQLYNALYLGGEIGINTIFDLYIEPLKGAYTEAARLSESKSALAREVKTLVEDIAKFHSRVGREDLASEIRSLQSRLDQLNGALKQIATEAKLFITVSATKPKP